MVDQRIDWIEKIVIVIEQEKRLNFLIALELFVV